MSAILMAPWMVQGAITVFNKTIAADVSNYNLRADAIAAGWDGVQPLAATITINSGIVVSANNTSNHAFDTGAPFPAGSALALINNGHVIGMGGDGGSGGGSGVAGGPALRAQSALSVTNNGTIGGGGGGSASGAVMPTTYGGGGGRSGRTNSAGGTGTYNGQPGTFAAPGGNSTAGGLTGGDWGAKGTTSGSSSGGAGGAAVVGDSFITWLVTGTRMGAIT